jgi:phosphate/phosphite/phosphonate ABC transporter binding protein
MHGLKRFAAIGLLGIGAPLVLASCPAVAAGPDGLAEEGVLKVGIIPAEDARAVVRQSKDVMEQISKALNTKTEIFVGSDYNATIEAMRASKVDVALMGAFGYVLATTQAPVEAFAVTVTKASNSPDYHSIIIARKDEGDLTSLDSLKGHTFAFVDPSSTSGSLMPKAAMMDSHIVPEKDLKKVIYSGVMMPASSPLRRARSMPHPSPTAFMRTLARRRPSTAARSRSSGRRRPFPTTRCSTARPSPMA